MKFTQKIFFWTLIGFFCTEILIGCKEKESTPDITGKWDVVSLHKVGSITTDTTIHFDTTVFLSGINTAEFKSNDTCIFISDSSSYLKNYLLFDSITTPQDTEKHRWSISENLVTLYDTGSSKKIFRITTDGNSLTFRIIIYHFDSLGTVGGTAYMNMVKIQ